MNLGSPRPILVGIAALVIVCCGVVAAQGQGDEYPPTAEVSDQKAGSILLFPYYTSEAGSNAHNTRINVTQTADVPISTRIYLIRTNGAVLARHLCLQAKQTDSYLTGSVDPGNSGYILIVAVDANGCPVSANTLIGDVTVKRATGHSASLAAYAYAAQFSGTLDGCSPASDTATLNLDGTDYNRSPRTVAIDKIRSRADGNDTVLILNRVGGNLVTGSIDSIGDVSGTLFDQSGTAHPFLFNVEQPQLVRTLNNAFPATAPPFGTVVGPGTVGWMKMAGEADIGLLGAVLNFNANAAAAPGAFNGGHGLRALSVTPAASFVMQVEPGC